MGTARRLTDQEVKEWLVKVPYSKGDLKRFKSIEHPDWIRTEEYDRSHTQRQYEFWDQPTTKGLKALDKSALIIHIEQVLEKGLLQPGTFNQHESSWHLLEEYLFKHVNEKQVEELPEKYQLLLGYKDGGKIFQIASVVRAEAAKAKANKATRATKAAERVKANQIKELKPSDSQGKNGKFLVRVLEKVVDGKEQYLTITVETIGEAKYHRRIFNKQVDKANQTWWDRFDGVQFSVTALLLAIPLTLLGLCMSYDPDDVWKCSDSSLTDSQERACDRAFEDAYEKKWGKSPYGR